MSEKKDRKRLLILIAVILAIILVLAIVAAVLNSRQNVRALRPSRLNDDGWEMSTAVLDEGGVGLFTYENGRGYLVVGRGSANDGTDYRDCQVNIDDSREDGQRVMRISIDSPKNSEGQRGYTAPDSYNKPLAIYQFKLRDAERMELYIDGEAVAFTFIIQSDQTDVVR